MPSIVQNSIVAAEPRINKQKSITVTDNGFYYVVTNTPWLDEKIVVSIDALSANIGSVQIQTTSRIFSSVEAPDYSDVLYNGDTHTFYEGAGRTYTVEVRVVSANVSPDNPGTITLTVNDHE